MLASLQLLSDDISGSSLQLWLAHCKQLRSITHQLKCDTHTTLMPVLRTTVLQTMVLVKYTVVCRLT